MGIIVVDAVLARNFLAFRKLLLLGGHGDDICHPPSVTISTCDWRPEATG